MTTKLTKVFMMMMRASGTYDDTARCREALDMNTAGAGRPLTLLQVQGSLGDNDDEPMVLMMTTGAEKPWTQSCRCTNGLDEENKASKGSHKG